MWFQAGPPLHDLHCNVLHGHCPFLPHPSRPLRWPVRPDCQNAPLYGSPNSHQSRQQPKQPGTTAGELIYFPVPKNQIPLPGGEDVDHSCDNLCHTLASLARPHGLQHPRRPLQQGEHLHGPLVPDVCQDLHLYQQVWINKPTAQALRSSRYFQCNQSDPVQRSLYEVSARFSSNPLLRPAGQWSTKLLSSSHPLCVRCRSITPQVANYPNPEIILYFLSIQFHSHFDCRTNGTDGSGGVRAPARFAYLVKCYVLVSHMIFVNFFTPAHFQNFENLPPKNA